jgi:hypothetical protein
MGTADWLPPPERPVPAGSAEGTAIAAGQFRRAMIAAVALVPLAVAGPFLGGVVLVILCVVAGVFAVYAAFAWSRRLGTIRATGWRTATVTIDPVRANTGRPPIAVTFADGSRIELLAAEGGFRTRALAGLPDLPALVAGTDR